MAPAADPEAVVRSGEAELREERAGHRLVVVLAGVDEDLVVPCPQDGQEGGRLDELRARPDDADDPHGSAGWHRRPLALASGRGRRSPAGGGRDPDAEVGDPLGQLELAQAVAAVEEDLEVREPGEVEVARTAGRRSG